MITKIKRLRIVRTNSTKLKYKLEEIIIIFFLFPALALFITFQVIPTLWAIYFSFTDIALYGKKLFEYKFIGLNNYEKLFSDEIFWKSFSVTFEYCTFSLLLRFTLGFIAALYITSRLFKGKAIIAGLLIIPYTLPGAVIPYMWISMLDSRYGTLNKVLMLLGLPPQSWLYERAMQSVVMVNCWSGYVLAMLILASAIKSIPDEYYEVCEIYGASRLFKFTKITLPLIKWPLVLSLILIFKEDIDDFTYVFILTEGGPNYRTELLSLYAYHKAFAFYELGAGCAVGLIIMIIVFLLTLAQIKISRIM